MAGILAFAEARDGQVRKIAQETVSAARAVADRLGGEVHALVLGGTGVGAAAGELGAFGAEVVHVGESDALARYSPEGFTTVTAALAREQGYDALFFPTSAMGADLAPRVAARLGVGYASDCTGVEVEGGTLIATRPRYAGKLLSRVVMESKPAVLSIRSNAFPVTESTRPGEVKRIELSLNAADFGAVVREIQASAGAALDVAEAPVVVSGGRGLREPENFRMLEELAAAFGNAAVGASRAVVDAGWRPHAEQVGQTGKTVSPKLYIAVGISGAIQHLAGMRTARFIVAINKDPDAPIFKMADYGIVGDLFEIVPRLTEEVRKLRG